MRFEVVCSGDLENWVPLAAVTNLTSTLEFEDPETNAHTCRFYRVR